MNFLFAAIVAVVAISGSGSAAPAPGDLADKYPSFSVADILDKKAPSLIPSKSEFPISGSQSYGNYHKALGDSGPGDTGHEMHAKMEEAIEHALAIINGAAKFAEEAQLEQETLPGKGDSEARYKRAIKEAADSIREEMEDQK